MTEEQFIKEYLPSQGISSAVRIGNGRWAGIKKFMFTCAIVVGDIGDDQAYSDRWCYGLGEDNQRVMIALCALLEWAVLNFEGEPTGWHRHPMSGRRREHGDPNRETISI